MRERKYVKFRVDMYEDTKFKIIDRRPERDLIHHVWNRVVVLAGKVNLEGELYLSKNIPYSIETLAIEFNRDIDEVKIALEVLRELEMLELTEGNIYSVKNFAKHQNIKVKEKIKAENNDEEVKNEKVQVKEILKNEISGNESKKVNKGKKHENKIIQIDEKKINRDQTGNLELTNKDTNKIDDNTRKYKINDNLPGNIPMLPEQKKGKKPNKSRKNDKIEEEIENDIDIIGWFSDYDERPLAKDENVVQAWSF